MVKPDVKHNYYNDLDLPTTASIDDVRKAYRKLALQFHPDRNAGRESECVPRFQAVQAANEVLSDPSIKAKYDQDRRKAGFAPGSSYKPGAPTGHPYATTSDFPPPPRRTQPGTWNRPNATAGPARPPPPASGAVPTGADRFSNFPRATNNAPRKDSGEQFRAWQNLNTANRGRGSNPAAPRPPPREPATGAAPTRPRAQRQDTRMPSEEQIRAGMRYGAGKGPSQAFDSDSAEGRKSAWDALNSQQGPFGKPGLGRSRTQRTPKKPGGFDPNAPGSDERPAPQSGYSHRHRSEGLATPVGGTAFWPPPPPGPPPTSNPQSPLSPDSDNYGSRAARTPAEEVPFTEGHRDRTPYTSQTREKTHLSSENLRRSASTKDAYHLNPENASRASRARSTSPFRHSHRRSGSRGQTFHPGDSSDSSDDDLDSAPTSDEVDTTEVRAKRPTNATTNATTNVEAQHQQARPKKTPTVRKDRPMQQREGGENIFTFVPPVVPFSTADGKRPSEENINTEFSPEPFNGAFRGSPDYFSPPNVSRRASPIQRNSQRQRSTLRSATTDAASPSQSPFDKLPHSPRFGSDGQNKPVSQSTPSDAPFDPHWHQKFQDTSWLYPPGVGPKPGASPESASGTSSGKPSVSAPANSQPVPDNKSAASLGTQAHAPSVNADDGDAMDIDTPPRSRDPSQAGSTDTTIPNGSTDPSHLRAPQSSWYQVPKQTSGIRKTPRASRAYSGKLETNLDDLKNVEPMAKSADEGLKNLADLASTLPFQSQPSDMPSSFSRRPARLDVPALPVMPQVPPKLTKVTWKAHAEAFARYIKQFHIWNHTMLDHFDAREKTAEERIVHGMAWLVAVGDVGSSSNTSSHGIFTYMKEVQEDEQVRTAWNVGWDKHGEALIEFEKVRERVTQLAKMGALKDG